MIITFLDALAYVFAAAYAFVFFWILKTFLCLRKNRLVKAAAFLAFIPRLTVSFIPMIWFLYSRYYDRFYTLSSSLLPREPHGKNLRSTGILPGFNRY